jgi:hypothetical protein
VIGPNAVEPMFGSYSGETGKGVGILAGVRALAPAGVSIEHAEGVVITRADAKGRHHPRSKIAEPPVAEKPATGRPGLLGWGPALDGRAGHFHHRHR